MPQKATVLCAVSSGLISYRINSGPNILTGYFLYCCNTQKHTGSELLDAREHCTNPHPHSNAQQHTVTHSDTLQHNATQCNTRQHSVSDLLGARGQCTNRIPSCKNFSVPANTHKSKNPQKFAFSPNSLCDSLTADV